MWLVYFILFLILSIRLDSEHLKDNDFIESHTSRWLLRGTFMIAAAVDVFSFFAMLFYWMGMFDSGLNITLKKDINHLGTTAKWDKFWTRYKDMYLTMKIIVIYIGSGLSVLSILNIY
jgi:hypothetical protein